MLKDSSIKQAALGLWRSKILSFLTILMQLCSETDEAQLRIKHGNAETSNRLCGEDVSPVQPRTLETIHRHKSTEGKEKSRRLGHRKV